MFYRRPRAMLFRFNHWLLASVALFGCAGRTQSSCETADQCGTPSGGQSHSSGGTGNHAIEAGASGGRMGGTGKGGAISKGGATGKGAPVTVDPRSDSQLPSIAGRANGGAGNSGGSEAVAGGTTSTGNGGAGAFGGSAGNEAPATTGWCATP